jgi:hypothetical protein
MQTGKKRIREGNNKWKPHSPKINPFQKTENTCKKKKCKEKTSKITANHQKQ